MTKMMKATMTASRHQVPAVDTDETAVVAAGRSFQQLQLLQLWQVRGLQVLEGQR